MAIDLLEEEDPKWAQVTMKIARCEDLINPNSANVHSIVKKVANLYPKYKPIDEEEKKLFEKIKDPEWNNSEKIF